MCKKHMFAYNNYLVLIQPQYGICRKIITVLTVKFKVIFIYLFIFNILYAIMWQPVNRNMS